jgi:hypothetical protein
MTPSTWLAVVGCSQHMRTTLTTHFLPDTAEAGPSPALRTRLGVSWDPLALGLLGAIGL